MQLSPNCCLGPPPVEIGSSEAQLMKRPAAQKIQQSGFIFFTRHLLPGHLQTLLQSRCHIVSSVLTMILASGFSSRIGLIRPFSRSSICIESWSICTHAERTIGVKISLESSILRESRNHDDLTYLLASIIMLDHGGGRWYVALKPTQNKMW